MLTLDVECRPDGTAAIAAVGEVDAATAARLSAAVHRQLDRVPSMLMLDMHEVTFLGVAGLQVLLCAADRVMPSEDDDVIARHSKRHAMRRRAGRA